MLNIILDRPKFKKNLFPILRLLIGLNSYLHICGPIDFSEKINSKLFNTDYIIDGKVFFYKNIVRCFNSFKFKNIIIVENEEKNIIKKNKKINTYVFGPENGFVFNLICKKFKNNIIKLPISGLIRSYNLSSCVALMTYSNIKRLINNK